MSPFQTAPHDIIQEIAFHVALLSLLGPPAFLPAFLSLSRRVYSIANRHSNPQLYARIFAAIFDTSAVHRRIDDTTIRDQADELVRRCLALKRIKHNAYPRPPPASDTGLRVDMWTAYIMFLECDGRNAPQLIHYARVDRFARDFVRPGGRLHDDAQQGWVQDTEMNALAMWLFWFTDNERAHSETPAEREEIMAALFPLYAGTFKYPSAHAPLIYFLIPPPSPGLPPPPPPLSILTLAMVPQPPPCIIPDHFGFEITLACPLLLPPALLSYTVRFERRSHLIRSQHGWVPRGSHAPATRAERALTGWRGATAEDYEAFGRLETACVQWGGKNSTLHEHDWMRLRTCYDFGNVTAYRDRVFTAGMLSGVWDGRWLGLPSSSFQAHLHTAREGGPLHIPPLPGAIEAPMQFRIREHHQHDQDKLLEYYDITEDGVGVGALQAWLPPMVRMIEEEGRLRVYDTGVVHEIYGMHLLSEYVTYDPLHAVLNEELEHVGYYGGGVWDIILTGETLPDFGEAWGHYRFVGRVRDWDGLVVLVREDARGADVGRWLFSGYVHGNKNLVGRWRETATPVDVPAWGGVWSMSKME